MQQLNSGVEMLREKGMNKGYDSRLQEGTKVGEREVVYNLGGHPLNTKICNHKALNTFSHVACH